MFKLLIFMISNALYLYIGHRLGKGKDPLPTVQDVRTAVTGKRGAVLTRAEYMEDQKTKVAQYKDTLYQNPVAPLPDDIDPEIAAAELGPAPTKVDDQDMDRKNFI